MHCLILPLARLFDGIAVSLIRYFIGDYKADSLGLPQGDWTQRLIRPLRFFNALTDETNDQVAAFARIASLFGQKWLEGMLWLERGGERTQFNIPTELRQSWGMI